MDPRGQTSKIASEYRPLHKYLSGRFADSVVLTFTQIEDLIGLALPGQAYAESGWWTSDDPGGAPSPQSAAWIQANRTATVNMVARTVMFDRLRA